MSAEGKCPYNYDSLLAALKELLDREIAHVDQNTKTAKDEIDRRLESMNEFRAQLEKQASTFVTVTQFDFTIRGLAKDIRELLESKAKLEGKASQNSVLLAYAISVIAIIISVAKMFV